MKAFLKAHKKPVYGSRSTLWTRIQNERLVPDSVSSSQPSLLDARGVALQIGDTVRYGSAVGKLAIITNLTRTGFCDIDYGDQDPQPDMRIPTSFVIKQVRGSDEGPARE
eukprot:7740261-Karenia_brevis.AAC.1